LGSRGASESLAELGRVPNLLLVTSPPGVGKVLERVLEQVLEQVLAHALLLAAAVASR
jgi:hypothetical protein